MSAFSDLLATHNPVLHYPCDDADTALLNTGSASGATLTPSGPGCLFGETALYPLGGDAAGSEDSDYFQGTPADFWSDDENQTEFVMGGWFYSGAFSGGDTGGDAFMTLDVAGGEVNFSLNDDTSTEVVALDDDRGGVDWTTPLFVCAVGDGTDVTLYINGASVASVTHPTFNFAAFNGVIVGGASGLAGTVADLFFLDAALTAAEVAALFTAGFSNPVELIDYMQPAVQYHLDESDTEFANSGTTSGLDLDIGDEGVTTEQEPLVAGSTLAVLMDADDCLWTGSATSPYIGVQEPVVFGLWMSVAELSGYSHVLFRSSNYAEYLQIYIADGGVGAYALGGGGGVLDISVAEGVPAVDTTMFLLLTSDGATWTMYLDGVEIATDTHETPNMFSSDDLERVEIGSDGGPATIFDEVFLIPYIAWNAEMVAAVAALAGSYSASEIELPSIVDDPALTGLVSVETHEPGPQNLDLPSIVEDAPLEGISVSTDIPVDEDDFESDVYVELREHDGTLVAALPNAYGVNWTDPHNEVGAGGFSLPDDDPLGAELTVNRDIWCYYKNVLAYHVVINKPPRRLRYSDQNESGEFYTVTGDAVLSEMAYAKILPFRDPDDPLPFMPQHRLYNFASPDFVYELGGSGYWNKCIQFLRADEIDPIRKAQIEYHGVYGGDLEDEIEYLDAPAPLGWKVPTAYWIWPDADNWQVGFAFFRSTLTLSEQTDVVFDMTADNYYTFYLDGHPLIGENEVIDCWKVYIRHTVTLQAGTYSLAFAVENLTGVYGTNPAGLLFAAYTADNDGEPVDILEVSNNTWDGIAYPSEIPGWTGGGILVDALDEAQDRGFLTDWTFTFNAINDSYGNPWPMIPNFSTQIGSSLLDVVQSLTRQGWIDIRVLPGSRTLHAFIQSPGPNAAAVFAVTTDEATTNVKTDDFDGEYHPISSIVVKWADGYTTVAGSNTYGDREEFMVTDSNDVGDANRQGQLELDRRVQRWTNVLTTSPLGDTDSPYLGFLVGFRVTAPGPTTGSWLRAVKAITIQADEHGRVEPILDLDHRVIDEETEALDTLFSSLGSGVTGSNIVRNIGMASGRTGGGSALSASNRPLVEGTVIREPRVVYAPAKADLPVHEIVFSISGDLEEYNFKFPEWPAIYDLSIVELGFLASSVGAGLYLQVRANTVEWNEITIIGQYMSTSELYPVVNPEGGEGVGMQKGDQLRVWFQIDDDADPPTDIMVSVRYIDTYNPVQPFVGGGES